MKNQKLKARFNKALANFTLAKFCGALITVTILAVVKYIISGNFHIEYSDFLNNVAIGLLGWTINTGLMGWLTEYLGIKGINFNLNQFIYGFETMKVGETTKMGETSSVLEDGKPKLYNAMDSGEGSSSGKKSGSRKGGYKERGRDVRVHPYPQHGRRIVRSWTFDDESDNASNNGHESDTEMEGAPSNKGKSVSSTSHSELPLDKGKSIAPSDAMQELPLDKGKGIEAVNPTQGTPLPIWTKPFPVIDPNLVLFKPRINPGPGFAVPGGEVPIRDPICEHIDYNGHILSQFKNMDWETAMKQRYNYLLCGHNMNSKIAFAQETLNKVPTIPTTEYEFKLRNQILRDLEGLNRVKVRSEARSTLLEARIKFIEDICNYNNNNNNNNN